MENRPSSSWRRRAGLAVAIAGWLVLALTVAAWVVLRGGDRWAAGTVLMFGPRWVFVLPPALLLLVAIPLRRRALVPIVPALLVAAGPVAGLCIPFERIGGDTPDGVRLCVLTCNMHYAKVDPGPLDRLVEETRPDVIAIQEWRDSASSGVFLGESWHTQRVTGLFLASRYPIRRAERIGDSSVGERGSVMRYEIDTPGGTIAVFNLHLATPRRGLGALIGLDREALGEIEANSELRRRQSEFVASEGRVGGPVVVMGDFNTPPESVLFREVWAGFGDAFADAGWGWGYTFRSRRAAVRVDHILVGGGGRAVKCWVGPDVGSPHRPVLAEVQWPASGAR